MTEGSVSNNHDREPPENAEAINARLSQIEADLSSQDSWARAFKESVDRRFDDLKSALNDLRTDIARKDQPVPWVQIGALLVGVVGVMTAYINTRLVPLESYMQETRGEIRTIQSTQHKSAEKISYLKGYQEATNQFMIEEVKEVRERLRETELRSASLPRPREP